MTTPETKTEAMIVTPFVISPAPTSNVVVNPNKIAARTKAEFIQKVKDALKKDYKPLEVVDLATFSAKYEVTPKNIKLAINELNVEGYALALLTALSPV
jgi:hypothetical protein